MKSALKRFLRDLGLHVYTDRSLPTGVSWLNDLARAGVRGPTCFDVGANVGQTVDEILDVFPDATIHAFEPVQATYARLNAHVSGRPRVRTYPIAFGAQAGRVEIALQAQSVRNSLVGAAPVGVASGSDRLESITVATIDEFCAEHRVEHIDILKTDTEGYDVAVLQGALGALGAGRIAYVYSEVSFVAGNPQFSAFAAVMELLSARGFRFLGLYETYPLHFFEESNAFCNALFGHRSAVGTRR